MADQQATLLPTDTAAPPSTSESAQPTELSGASTTSALSLQPTSASPTPPSPSLPPQSSSSSSPPLPPLSTALYDAVHPALAQCDAAIDSVFTSQAQLASQIDTLAALLASFNALHRSSATLFSPYTAKLQSAKKRIKRLQTSVDRINGRLNDMRDVVRRKEGLVGGAPVASVGGLAGRLSLSSIATIAQQALAVGGSTLTAGAASSGLAGDETVTQKAVDDDEKDDESAAVSGDIDSIETLAPVLDKTAAPTTYGSLPASAPSPTAASSPITHSTATESDTANGTAAGGGAGSTAGALPKSSSLSSAPPTSVRLHDLLAWDGQ